MYKYETHLHTSPVSTCAHATVGEQLEYYKSLGFAGVFITNHFIGGNTTSNNFSSYNEQVEYYFSDYEDALKLGKEIGLTVFCGIEIGYKGTDFLVYGLDKNWYLENPQIMDMTIKEKLAFMMAAGALIIQAHPYREASYIDHIRLFPRSVHGAEVFNACRKDLENKMAKIYAENYNLLPFAGSDNHVGASQKILGGMEFDTPLLSEQDFVSRILDEDGRPFTLYL